MGAMTSENGQARLQSLESDDWQKLASRFLDDNYRGSWAFARACAARVGARSEHVGIRQGEDWIGASDVRIKTLPFGLGGIAYINGGPLVRIGDDSDLQRLEDCLHTLIHDYVEGRGLVLRILAPLGDAVWNESSADVFQSCGFLPTNRSQAYRTIVLDLTRSPEDIRKSLHQKWRNCLNKAERQGLEI